MVDKNLDEMDMDPRTIDGKGDRGESMLERLMLKGTGTDGVVRD